MLFFSKSSMAVESGINSSCVHSCLAKGKRPGPSECGSPLFLSESQDLLEILCTACCRVYFNHISKSQIGSSGTHMSSVLTSPLWHNFDQICFFFWCCHKWWSSGFVLPACVPNSEVKSLWQCKNPMRGSRTFANHLLLSGYCIKVCVVFFVCLF